MLFRCPVTGTCGWLRISQHSQKAFTDFLKLNFPILSDFPDLKAIAAYGVLNQERRMAQRSYFVVDKQGIVRYKKLIASGEPLVPNDALVEDIRKRGAS